MKSQRQIEINRECWQAGRDWVKQHPTKDPLLLKLSIREHHADWWSAHERVHARREYLRCLKEYAENGEIAIVYGFRDCDCAVSDGNVRILPATKEAVAEWEEDFYSGAEGPQWWGFERPSVARGIRRTSRDLALEAYEDGHSHIVSETRFDEEGSYYV